MARVAQIIGVSAVLRKLKITEAQLGKALERGMVMAGLHLQRKSQQVVPIDKNILRPSADTRQEGSSFKTVVIVGYFGVDYAIYVHERLDLRHKPGKIAKYLEKPARQQRFKMGAIIARQLERVG